MNPFIRARLVAPETKRVSEQTPEDASSTFLATPRLERIKVMLSRCMTGQRWHLLKRMFSDSTTSVERIFHSPARRTIVIMVPREDDECTSGYAELDKAMYGTKEAAHCFDVAREIAMTAMGYATDKFSLWLYHSSAVDMSVFRHGDDFVVSGIEELATLGPCTALGDVTEVKILNRIVRWVKPPYGSGCERT